MALRYRSAWTKLIIFSAVIIGIYGICEIYRCRDYQSDFISQKGRLVSTKETLLYHRSTDSLVQIQLEGDNGIEVEGYLRIPSSTDGPHPALIILGGLGTGKRVLDYIENTDGLVLLALDYPYRGKTRKLRWWEFLANLPGMRRAILNTPPAVMLCVDYLEARRDIDRSRIILIGGSLGALFVPAIAAADPRISGVALLFGAGDLQSLLRTNISVPEPIASIVSWIGAILVSPVEPLKYIDRVSPRPLFMLNGTGDTRMPSRCSRLLYDKAGPPKTIVWIPAEHLHVSSNKFHDRVRKELEVWLVQNKILLSDLAEAQHVPE